MGMKFNQFSERQLFLYIEQEIEDSPVFFQYSSEFVDEADGIIMVIPLYVEGNFGTIIAKWIKPSSTIGTKVY